MIISDDAEKELDKSQHPFQIFFLKKKQLCKPGRKGVYIIWYKVIYKKIW